MRLAIHKYQDHILQTKLAGEEKLPALFFNILHSFLGRFQNEAIFYELYGHGHGQANTPGA